MLVTILTFLAAYAGFILMLIFASVKYRDGMLVTKDNGLLGFFFNLYEFITGEVFKTPFNTIINFKGLLKKHFTAVMRSSSLCQTYWLMFFTIPFFIFSIPFLLISGAVMLIAVCIYYPLKFTAKCIQYPFGLLFKRKSDENDLNVAFYKLLHTKKGIADLLMYKSMFNEHKDCMVKIYNGHLGNKYDNVLSNMRWFFHELTDVIHNKLLHKKLEALSYFGVKIISHQFLPDDQLQVQNALLHLNQLNAEIGLVDNIYKVLEELENSKWLKFKEKTSLFIKFVYGKICPRIVFENRR